MLAVFAAGCTASPASTPSPAAATGTPAASLPHASEPPAVTPSAPPSGAPGTCPSVPADFATIRDLAKAGDAVACFDAQDLTFRAYVPVTGGLNVVDTSVMTPGWIANPFTGTLLQPAGSTAPDQSAWWVVRVSLAIGKCRITSEPEPCPFTPYLGKDVTVTGHFNDPAAEKCASVPLANGTDPGPAKSQMVARCKKEFVVTAIAAG